MHLRPLCQLAHQHFHPSLFHRWKSDDPGGMAEDWGEFRRDVSVRSLELVRWFDIRAHSHSGPADPG